MYFSLCSSELTINHSNGKCLTFRIWTTIDAHFVQRLSKERLGIGWHFNRRYHRYIIGVNNPLRTRMFCLTRVNPALGGNRISAGLKVWCRWCRQPLADFMPFLTIYRSEYQIYVNCMPNIHTKRYRHNTQHNRSQRTNTDRAIQWQTETSNDDCTFIHNWIGVCGAFI